MPSTRENKQSSAAKNYLFLLAQSPSSLLIVNLSLMETQDTI